MSKEFDENTPIDDTEYWWGGDILEFYTVLELFRTNCPTFFGTKRYTFIDRTDLLNITKPLNKTDLVNDLEKISMNKGFLSGFTQNDQGKPYEDELKKLRQYTKEINKVILTEMTKQISMKINSCKNKKILVYYNSPISNL